ncbi:RNA helicase [Pholiota conissans]|uniref:RNA helicase n=1 Tax=Pholiota conissans TaxID=109636 RepID=A0A9P5ZFR1_9AGAR|nr:RNA helicase [Pholiota conissans]
MVKPNYTPPTYCVPFVTTGCTFGQSCSLQHDIFKCECGLILALSTQEAHRRGKRHKELIAAAKPTKSKKRRGPPKDNAQQQQQDGHSEPVEQLIQCEDCRKKVESAEYDAHVEEHQRQQRLEALNASLAKAAEDKHGVTVTGRSGIDFGIIDLDTKVETVISITSHESRVALKKCRMQSSNRGDDHGVKFSATLRGRGSPVIQKGMTRDVSVVMHPSDAGRFEDTLELVFFDIDLRQTFIITRAIEATVGSREDHELLRPKAPYARRKIVKFNPVGSVVPSSRPPAWTKTVWVDRLLGYDIPKSLLSALSIPGKGISSAVKRFMPTVFNEKTYGSWFQVLLHIEEERVKSDLDAYSLSDVELQPDHPRYKLLVEGLAEGRPSVLVGDFVLVSHTESAETLNKRTWYEGRVHKVYENHVSLHFNDGFSTYRGTKFDVRFVLNRLPYRRMHQAVTNKNDQSRILFPEPKHIQGVQRVPLEKIVGLVPFYRPIGEDEEQTETVAAIVDQKPGSVPFVVFGPPGTGKTVTIVEAMRQLLAKDPDVRILACAPNNSAADTLAVKLMDLGKSQVFRLNSLSRKIEEMPKILREYSSINSNLVFSMPQVEPLSKFRVVVSTCLSAGVPTGLGLKRGHFTHIFIDEAGQGKEPELMVAIKNNADKKTNLILAGDNQQLGPVINSPLASILGLKLSYLARIMQREIYNLNTGKGITIVKLIKNFRSHPDILKFSNDQFYNSELSSCGEPAMINSLVNYEELPKRRFPVVFHGIVGKDEREKSSPSFFNIDEATQVKKYCTSLLGNKKNGIKAEHIGVITPYHAQRCKILDLLYKDHKMRDIKVGSVEEFQGQERRVIIISTVRSNKEFITADIRRSLGFVANKNRLNVALTRAQALLIVIGNPIVLSLDPIWRGFLNYVYNRGGWRGKKIDWDPLEPILSTDEFVSRRKAQVEGEMEETIARLQAMIINQHADTDELDIELDDDAEAAAFERPVLREAE